MMAAKKLFFKDNKCLCIFKRVCFKTNSTHVLFLTARTMSAGRSLIPRGSWEICGTECINLYSDLYNITKNDTCISSLKRGVSSLLLPLVLLLPLLALWCYYVVAGIFVIVIVAAVDGIGISSTFCVWERELTKRVMMAENTGFNNSLLCKANDNEGVNPMCTDKETVKTKWRKEVKVNNLSLSLKT